MPVVGPVFWLQDHTNKEIVLWKRGWLRTTVWMAPLYAFLCSFEYSYTDPFVKFRFLSTSNAAPSTNHDWNSIGNVPRIILRHCLFLD